MNMYQTINEGTDMMVNNIDEQNFFLSHLRSDMHVLEFGCGISTLTIAPLVASLTSIEHNQQWATITRNKLKPNGNEFPNVHIVHVAANHEPSPEYDDGTYEDFKDYVDAIKQTAADAKWDVIFIDGRARVDCARVCIPYLREGGFIFIHDYRHPTEIYRRREYEVVEEFLDHVGQVFAMGKFTPKPDYTFNKETGEVIFLEHNMDMELVKNENPMVDQSTCWYDQSVVDEMNRFYDQHIYNHEIQAHFKPFTDLLSAVECDHKLLLDLGCGTAALSMFCKEYIYHGADLGHVIEGCAMRNFPQYGYAVCDLVKDDLGWLRLFNVVVINGIIDVMQHPLIILHKILDAMAPGAYLIIHRQEITEEGKTHTIINGSYGGTTYHSIISRSDFAEIVEINYSEIIKETKCGFANWENGGSSFLIKKLISS